MTSGSSRTCRRATRTTTRLAAARLPPRVLETGDGSEAQLRNVLSGPELGIPQMIAAGEWPTERPFVVLMPQYSDADARALRAQRRD